MKCYHLGGNFYFDINCVEALLVSHNFSLHVVVYSRSMLAASSSPVSHGFTK